MKCGACGSNNNTAKYVCTKCGKEEMRELKEGEVVKSCCGETMVRKEEYIDKLAAQLKEWSTQIAVLKAKAGKEKAEIKVALDKELVHLGKMMNDAQKNLKDLTGKSNEAWKSLAEGTNKAWNDLRVAMHQAAEKFK